MLDYKKFYQGVIVLNTAFSENKLPLQKESLEVWHNALSDLTDEMFEVAVLHIVRSHKFYPKIAEIRETAFSLCTTEHGKTGDEAWGEVMAEISRTGTWGEPQFKDEITAQAVKNLGWTEICTMDLSQMEITRAQFRNLYNNLKNRAKNSDSLKALNPEYHAMLNSENLKLEG